MALGIGQLLEFLDVPVGSSWDLSPSQAIAYMKGKGLTTTFNWQQLVGEEHARAFTVAKMMDADLLATVKESLDAAQAAGKPFQQWADELIPTLQAKGWWGRKSMVDPLTGNTIMAQLGSPSRLQTIYRTNMQTAYMAGQWDSIVDQAELAPFLLYDAVDDFRTRTEHAGWDGVILPITDAWWQTHYPPNGWNCRCTVVQLSQDDLDDLGLSVTATAPNAGTVPWTNPNTGKVQQVPKGIDPGWAHNVGEVRTKALAKQLADKVKGYPADLQGPAAKGFARAAQLGQDALLAPVDDVAALAKTTAKAAERAAAAQITAALEAKTPHLAKAIKTLQGTKAGKAMSATELLDAAKVEAAKIEQKNSLFDWKKAYTAGKAPSAKAQATFDALPEDAQLAMKAQLDLVKAENAAQAAAQAELDAIVPTSLAGKALGKIDAADLKPTELLAAVQLEVATAKAVQVQAQVAAATKKAMANGKQLTPAQAQYLGTLDDTGMAALLADVDKIKAANLPPPPVSAGPAGVTVTAPSTLNPDKLVQVGPQRGSNPGGLYRDTDTGETWYIKTPPSAEHARNEVLAAKLYQLAGADVPELRLTTLGGQPAVASRIVDDLVKTDGKTLAKTAGATDHFATDAWLANWDVAGATFDNLLVKAGKAMRVDTGGALRFRAQGGLKGQAFGNVVKELDSLRSSATNAQTAAVFGKMTQAELNASAQRLLAIDRAELDRLVDEFGPADLAERTALKATLRARLDNIGEQLGVKVDVAPPAPPLRPGGKFATATEFDRIVEARANGYTLSTDGDMIEDHQVLVQHYTGADGKPRTRLVTKLRGEGAKVAEAKVAPLAGGVPAGPAADLAVLRERTTALAKSINSRAAKGGLFDDTVVLRLEQFNDAADDAAQALGRAEDAGADVQEARKALGALRVQVRRWQIDSPGYGEKIAPIEQLNVGVLADVKAPPKVAKVGEPGGLAWSAEGRFTYGVSKFDNGRMIETADTQTLPAAGRVLVGEGEGVRVRFLPDDPKANSVSSRGLVHIDVDGQDLAAVDRAVATLADMGVTTTRTTGGQRLGLYLDKLANLRGIRDTKLRAKFATANAITDEAARNAAKLKVLNDEVGYDLTTSPHWNPEGVHQAFGHGRTLQMRPDLDGPDMVKFEQSTIVYTNVTGLGIGASGDQWARLLSTIDGGGILSSQMERARRGIRSTGSSVSADHQSGGANYIFTRLLPRNTTSPGVYFKPQVMRRIDAFSYDGDVYGSVAEDVQRARRQTTADGFLRNAGRSGNETNFRDGVSLFDDLERIIFSSAAEQQRAIRDMRARGYTTWPDGRPLEQVLLGPGGK